jgi:hypothetical protein
MVATALQIKQPRWGGALSTSYGLVSLSSAPDEESAVFTNSVTTSFRPSEFLRLEPSFSIKEERKHSTGARIQTPASGFSFTYSPPRSAFRLSAGTSFSRIFGTDGSSDIRIHGSSAALDWRLGSFLGRDDVLSFSFNYNNYLDSAFRANSYRGLSSMLQLKVAGF